MNAVLLQQTSLHLTREVRRWDRRLRLRTSLVWGVRALTAGFSGGVAIAVVARLTPWLLPNQIVLITALVTGVLLAGTLGTIWIWPRSAAAAARYFDRRFALKERVSTALEVSAGSLHVPEPLAQRQLSDAVNVVKKTNTNISALLPVFVVSWREIVMLLVMAGAFAFLILSDNPKDREILAKRDLQAALNQQAQNLADAVEQIDANDALTEAEKQALREPLNEAREILNQENISQQEAMAAMAQAEQAMSEMADGMAANQEEAYQQAASELAQSEMTASLAQALQQPDLSAAADEMEKLADDIAQNNLSEADRNALADRLEAAADQLEENNPALAEKLREAAEALRDGDIQKAQEAMREAAEMMREQQQQLQESEMAQAAQTAEQQLKEGQKELARTGQENSGEALTPQQGAQSQTQMQSAEQQQGEAQSGESQSGENGEGEPQAASSMQETGAEQSQAQQGAEGSTENQSPADATGGTGEGESEDQQTGGAQSGEAPGGEGQPGAAEGAPNTQEGEGGVNAPSAGQGEGGTGVDDTAGVGLPDNGGGEMPSNNASGETSGEPGEYDPANASSIIGGESNTTLDVGQGEGDSVPMQEGEFSENPSGESSMSYLNVFNRYRNIISNALESGRIPLDQRDIIHDYFSSLEP